MSFQHLHTLLAHGRPAEYPVAIRQGEVIVWRTVVRSIAALQHEVAASSSQRWLLSCRDALEFLIALFAVWHAGRSVVIPVNFQKERVCDEGVSADAVITQVPLVNDGGPLREFLPLDRFTTQVVLQTSGSTGVPKSICKTLFQLDAEVSALEQQWGAQLDDAWIIATVPHYHIYGLLFRLLWPFASGRTFVAEELPMPEDIQSVLIVHSPAVLVSSPSHLERIPALLDLSTLRPHITRIFSSGSPVSPQTAQVYADAVGFAPTEVLGSTETGGIAWREGGDVWTPLPDVDVRTISEDALEVRSPRTEDQDWYVTGDRAEYVGTENRFRLLGRIDRTAKIEGKRVALDDIENHLNTHAWIDRSRVVVLEGARTVLGVAAELSVEGIGHFETEGRSRVISDLKRYLAQWFEPVVIPRQWRFVTALPVDDRGKTTVAALTALFREG